jgi:hypothetical protein
MDDVIQWLLDGSAWVEYRTRIDLLGQSEDNPQVLKAHQEVLAHPQIQSLIDELANWPGDVLKSHKSAGHPIHKLTFLADLGLRATDPGVGNIVERILERQAHEGPFQVLANIHPRYGGAGVDQLIWMLCDAPLVVYALVKFGLEDNPHVLAALNHLISLIQENGWPCAVSPEAGKFRGPGRKDDPCPYANLVMLKALAQFPGLHDDPAVAIGVESLLSLWEERKERRPYLFAMGTDFTKLKAPLVWYDILHVMDVLSHFSWARKDARLQEMVQIVRSKADQDGRFTPESIWLAWQGWDFGQKREPSRWLTLVTQRMLKRAGV